MAMNYIPPTTLSAADRHWTFDFTQQYDDELTAATIGNTVVLCITAFICLFGVGANGMVLWYLGFRMRKSPFTVYILNLAIADIIFLLIFFSLLSMMFYENVDIGGYNTFEIICVCFLFGYVTSQYFLTAVSVERCLSILFPIWYKCRRPKQQSAIVCIVLWLLSGVALVANFILCIHYKHCEAISIIEIISFLLLLPLMILSNIILVIQICRRSQRQHPPRLYILIITTVLSFLFLSVPLSLEIVLGQFGISFIGYTLTAFVSPTINSSLNPVIYFLVGSLRQQRQRKCSIIASLRRAFVEE